MNEPNNSTMIELGFYMFATVLDLVNGITTARPVFTNLHCASALEKKETLGKFTIRNESTFNAVEMNAKSACGDHTV